MGQEIRDLWDFDDPAGSERKFRRAAETADGPDAAVLLTQVARAMALQERFDEGHALLDSLPEDGTAELRVRVALERGRLHRSSGDSEAARPYFAAAADAAEAAGLVDLRFDALHMAALAAPDPEAQVSANRHALALAIESSDPEARRWTASLMNNLGCALVDAGRLEEALSVFEGAVAERERRGDPRETQIARWMVGWTLRLLNRTEEALAVQTALKTEIDAAGIADPYVDEEHALLQSGVKSEN